MTDQELYDQLRQERAAFRFGNRLDMPTVLAEANEILLTLDSATQQRLNTILDTKDYMLFAVELGVARDKAARHT